WLNAANEVAVAAFLDRRIGWLAIAEVIAQTLGRWDGAHGATVEEVIDADRAGRLLAGEIVEGMPSAS
ncbi:MAG TPA: 1-deoxy-D-xylulose-5-phosphate reductoisomerase, partial [Acidimicrobiales bacterium]|nr:1-deoxy-D-xylulose-5-phosphate reductoisomerase [Acidimicrobiales bacterium]